MLDKHPTEEEQNNPQDSRYFDNESQNSEDESVESIKESRIY